MNEPVLLDTVGILAVLHTGDRWHREAVAAFVALNASSFRPFATSFILAEAANAASRTPLRPQVIALREQLEAWGRLVHPSTADWSAALEAYGKGEAGDAGLVDHLSFVVMRRLGIRRAFTNDRHFRAAGFETLF
ncbi:MAG: PIN domain-containing protein [Candidatus Sumerlaeia bacterium]|nr:PIN domain-containing protein [Candidatus Sumerlaeia bacterium]